MKKTYTMLLIFVFGLAFLPLSRVHANTTTLSTAVETSFKLKMTGAYKFVDNFSTLFTFTPTETVNPQNIVHWKIRFYCDDKLDIRANELEVNVCNKTVRMEKQDSDNFSLLFTNPTNKTSAFSFKMKAYDKNGKWLHSEKKSFQWK